MGSVEMTDKIGFYIYYVSVKLNAMCRNSIKEAMRNATRKIRHDFRKIIFCARIIKIPALLLQNYRQL
jgi:hypothetical protein